MRPRGSGGSGTTSAIAFAKWSVSASAASDLSFCDGVSLCPSPRFTGIVYRLIAAHAIDMGLTLVINNLADFEGYPGLRLENWAAQ